VSEIQDAAAAVSAGRLVVLPTDTVYGVGADAFSPSAVNALLAAKGRGRDMPVPVLVGSWSTVDGIASRVSGEARELIEAFWPGPLSIVLPQMPTLAWDLGDAGGTVMVRMPLHPMALELLEATGPMAVSSANRSGQPPAVTVEEARSQLGAAISIYLDGGPTAGPVPSTIVDASLDGPPRVLRLGTLTGDDLRAVVPTLIG
jgi:L-threonylcarbamoyladenylate synthase